MLSYRIRKYKLMNILALIGIGFLSLLFQNCAEDVDVSLYESSSLSSVGPTISKQSASTLNVQENANTSLFIEVSNLSNYQIEWYKNDTLVVGANALTLNFASTSLSDAGTYYAVVRYDTNLSLRSGNIALSVTADPNPRVYNTPYITFNAQNYYIYYIATAAAFNQNSLDAFCKNKIGSNLATYTSYTLGNNTTITRYAYAASQSDCALNPYAVTYSNGLCLSFYSAGFSAQIYSSITCKP